MNRPGPGLDLTRFHRSGVAPPSGDAPGPAARGSASAPAPVFREQRGRDVLASIESLQSLPTVVIQVLRLANDV
jgi:hypothetical protein